MMTRGKILHSVGTFILMFPLLGAAGLSPGVEQPGVALPPPTGSSAVDASIEGNNLLPIIGLKIEPAAPAKSDHAARARVAEAYGKLPPSFQAHPGEPDPPVE